MRTLRYTDGVDEVLVTVPWGHHTGLIPPPVIVFGSVSFLYDGDAD